MKKGKRIPGKPVRCVVSSGNSFILTGYVDSERNLYFDCAWEHDPSIQDFEEGKKQLDVGMRQAGLGTFQHVKASADQAEAIVDGILRPQNRNDQ